MANNNSKIPQNELSKLLSVVAKHYFVIVEMWKKYYDTDDIKFYC